jgi:nucleotide-binding universal stress UspA family protein
VAPADENAPLLIVVGFEGSERASRALDAAGRLVQGRDGSIHVVFVSHSPGIPDLSAEAAAELLDAAEATAEQVSRDAADHLGAVGLRCSFEHRQGDVAGQLIEAAGERRRDDYTVIVVGGSAHRLHRFVSSVPVTLVRHADVPVVVVP